MKKFLARCALVALIVGSSLAYTAAATRLKSNASTPAAPSAPPSDMWSEIDESSLGSSKQADIMISARTYRVFQLDQAVLADVLDRAPMEFSEAAKSSTPVVMTIPMPDGSLQRFRIQESPIMEPGLAARFPAIRTYIAQGIDDPAANVRFDRTPLGFHAQILSPNGTVYVETLFRGDTSLYASYYKRDAIRTAGFECLVAGSEADDTAEKVSAVAAVTGPTLRTYRLALSNTIEYASAACGHYGTAVTVDNVLAAEVISVNRIVGIYERDLAVRMVLVANNNLLVKTTSDTFSNTNPSAMLSQNQSACDTVIGAANYDIGHIFSTGGGGIAGLGVVCIGGQKGQGVTGTNAPYNDPFDVDYVAHEMGHQFGGNHTFNSTESSCGGGNRNASTAMEPGSGSTIQAYAGICGASDLQPNSDAYFHGISFDEMVNYTNSGGGNSCAVQTGTGNLAPLVEAGPNYTIPANTPFELTAEASDPNGDELTYCWEQFNAGASSTSLTTDNGTGAIIRSLNPTTSPTRSILGATAQVLPTTNRALAFRCTVRDNRAGGGGVANDSMTVTSTTTAGPFAVTAPNTATTFAGASAQTVTWNVASTNAGTVNTPNVTIFLSLDGGVTFPICLLANTPNDGSQVVTMPNVATSTARIKVKGAGNIFFDISNANFTITAATNGGDSAGVWVSASSTSFLRNSNTLGGADVAFGYGAGPSTFVPLVGDWDGNHSDTCGLYDPATGNFFLRNSNSGGGADLVFSFGAGGASIIPLRGDWNFDGVDTIGIYNATTGTFFLRNSNSSGPADVVFSFGPGGAFIPLSGDWNADGRDTIGIYDPATGNFFLRNSNTSGGANAVFSFGAGGATPLVGDWNLDGRDTIGIYLTGTGSWFLRNTNASGPADLAFGYGPSGSTAIVGDWDAL